jgi:hypothetical protein
MEEGDVYLHCVILSMFSIMEIVNMGNTFESIMEA